MYGIAMFSLTLDRVNHQEVGMSYSFIYTKFHVHVALQRLTNKIKLLVPKQPLVLFYRRRLIIKDQGIMDRSREEDM